MIRYSKSAALSKLEALRRQAPGSRLHWAEIHAGSEAGDAAARPWTLDQLAGRLVELSGVGATAILTAAFGLVLDAQRQGEPVAWVQLPGASFYPPDAADGGVDLASLVVVRAPGSGAAASAADRLIRSGAFGLVVLDLCQEAERARIPLGLQGRLVNLGQRHDAAVVCLTEKRHDAPSLGSMVSLRARVERAPIRGAEGVRCTLRVLKDKRRGPRWSHEEVVLGPAGLC